MDCPCRMRKRPNRQTIGQLTGMTPSAAAVAAHLSPMAAVSPRWTMALASPITAPTGWPTGTVYLACSDQHRVAALDARDGKLIWDYFAAGRIDTPPTVYRGLVLFGGRDAGHALRAADGYLAWRVRRKTVSFACAAGGIGLAGIRCGAGGRGGAVGAAAGLHGDADGGVWAATIDPATGRGSGGKSAWLSSLPQPVGHALYRSPRQIPDDASEKAMAAADPKLVAGMGNDVRQRRFDWQRQDGVPGGLELTRPRTKPGRRSGKAIFTHGVGLPTDTMLPSVYWNRLSWVYCGKDDQPAWMSAKQKTDAPGFALLWPVRTVG